MSKTPPIPPDQQSPGEHKTADIRDDGAHKDLAADRLDYDPDHRGHQGNSNINTHHQGYQQDR